MTGPDPMSVRAGETGIVRLFSLNMRPEQARFLQEPGAAAQALGVAELDPEQVDIFEVSDLEDLGLEGYLAEGAGIPADRIARDRDRLRALTGWVMAVRSRAFGGKPTELKPAKTLDLIGVFAEPGTDWSGGHIETDSTRPGNGPQLSPRAARAQSQRIGAGVFAVVMLVLAVIAYAVLT